MSEKKMMEQSFCAEIVDSLAEEIAQLRTECDRYREAISNFIEADKLLKKDHGEDGSDKVWEEIYKAQGAWNKVIEELYGAIENTEAERTSWRDRHNKALEDIREKIEKITGSMK